jgi:RNA polymerase sigma-70 factor (ECF subfamily)
VPALTPACVDDDALAALIRTYHARVVRYGRRVCRDDFDADDAVQEAFTKIAHRPDVARGPSPLGWLLTVVRRACMKLLRPFARERRVLGERVETDVVVDESTDLAAALDRWEQVRSIHAAIAKLDRPAREVIVLRDLEGFSAEETCKMLGLELAAMKSRLHRARLALRVALDRADATGSSGQRSSRGARSSRSRNPS